MIVRSVEELRGTSREVNAPTSVSQRLLLREDGMGFSFHVMTLFAGTESRMCYKDRLEAVLCIAGEGELEEVDTGEKYVITDGSMYALNNHDRHVLRARSNLKMVCVFNPPCAGQESPDSEDAPSKTEKERVPSPGRG